MFKVQIAVCKLLKKNVQIATLVILQVTELALVLVHIAVLRIFTQAQAMTDLLMMR